MPQRLSISTASPKNSLPKSTNPASNPSRSWTSFLLMARLPISAGTSPTNSPTASSSRVRQSCLSIARTTTTRPRIRFVPLCRRPQANRHRVQHGRNRLRQNRNHSRKISDHRHVAENGRRLDDGLRHSLLASFTNARSSRPNRRSRHERQACARRCHGCRRTCLPLLPGSSEYGPMAIESATKRRSPGGYFGSWSGGKDQRGPEPWLFLERTSRRSGK